MGQSAPGRGEQVTVLGAGITGLTLGLLVARAGHAVQVVDPGLRLGAPVGLTGAPVTLQQELQLHHVRSWHGARVALAYAQELRGGQELVETLSAELGVPSTRCDMVTVTADGHEAFWLRHEARAMREAGLSVQFSDHAQLPFSTRPVLLSPDQPVVDLVAYRDALVGALGAAGGELRREADTDTSTGWVVSTTGEPAFADARLRARLRPATWHWLELTGPGLVRRSGFDLDDGGRMWVPQGDRLWFGSRGDDGRRQAARWFERAEVTAHWRTTVADSWDALPLVGPVGDPSHRRLVATGFGCWELTSGTAAARQLAAAICAGTAELPWRLNRWPHPSAVLRASLGAVRSNLRLNRVTPFPRRWDHR